MKKRTIIFLSILLLWAGAPNGFCEDTDKSERVAAVQERIFFKHHELDLGVGYVGDDDFHYVYPLELGYTYNFTDHIAWNVADAHLMLNQEKDLREDLELQFGAAPIKFSKMKYAGHSKVVYKPIYGKNVFGEHRVINHEVYLFLGGGVISYEREAGDGAIDTEVAPSISFGIGSKVFLGEHLCLFFELKDWVNIREEKVENHVWFSTSLALRFNLTPRETAEDATGGRLDDYLE